MIAPLMRRMKHGWACQMCGVLCLRLKDAVDHAGKIHQAEIVKDWEDNIYDVNTLRVPYEIL